MEEANNDKITQLIISFSDFKTEMIKSMNYIREDMSNLRQDMKDLKDELKGDIQDVRNELREFKDETNKHWEENNKRWEANDKKWDKYEKNRVEDRDTIIDILLNYDISISKQLGDPNVEKMRKIV